MIFRGGSTNKQAIMDEAERLVNNGYVVVVIQKDARYELYMTSTLDTPTVFVGGWTRP